jgi:hypothetical protein
LWYLAGNNAVAEPGDTLSELAQDLRVPLSSLDFPFGSRRPESLKTGERIDVGKHVQPLRQSIRDYVSLKKREAFALRAAGVVVKSHVDTDDLLLIEFSGASEKVGWVGTGASSLGYGSRWLSFVPRGGAWQVAGNTGAGIAILGEAATSYSLYKEGDMYGSVRHGLYGTAGTGSLIWGLVASGPPGLVLGIGVGTVSFVDSQVHRHYRRTAEESALNAELARHRTITVATKVVRDIRSDVTNLRPVAQDAIDILDSLKETSGVAVDDSTGDVRVLFKQRHGILE